MFDPTSFYLFLLTVTAVILIPGADTLYVLTRSLQYGQRAGIVSTLGVCAGFIVHIAAATIGLSAFIMASANGLLVLKTLGAMYLFYLGVRMMMSKSESLENALGTATAQEVHYFWPGFFTNVLNPKVALFFLAFIPQFVDPSRSSPSLQLLVYGAINMGICLVWLSAIVFFSSKMRKEISSGLFGAWLNRVCGGLLILLGIRLFLSTESPQHYS